MALHKMGGGGHTTPLAHSAWTGSPGWSKRRPYLGLTSKLDELLTSMPNATSSCTCKLNTFVGDDSNKATTDTLCHLGRSFQNKTIFTCSIVMKELFQREAGITAAAASGRLVATHSCSGCAGVWAMAMLLAPEHRHCLTKLAFMLVPLTMPSNNEKGHFRQITMQTCWD